MTESHAATVMDRGESVGWVVDTPEELRALARRSWVARRRIRRELAFALPTLSSQENESATREVRELGGACGCAEGGAAALVTAAAYLVAALTDVAWLGDGSRFRRVLLGLVVVLLAGGVGKAIGLVRGRMRLSRALRDLVQRAEGGSKAQDAR